MYSTILISSNHATIGARVNIKMSGRDVFCRFGTQGIYEMVLMGAGCLSLLI